MNPEAARERDEADLRWFWCGAEADLGLFGAADTEHAPPRTPPPARCPACQPVCAECGGSRVRVHEPETLACEACGSLRVTWRGRIETGLRMKPSAFASERRLARAGCRACLGLGVVQPTTVPAATKRSASAGESPWMHVYRGRGSPVLSAREPGWMALVGGLAMLRRRHREIRIALVAMAYEHVCILHAVYGPPPPAFGLDAPVIVQILGAMNRAMPEKRRIEILQKLRTGGTDRFTMGVGRRHADMLLAASWRAYGRARGRVAEDREAAVADLIEMKRELASPPESGVVALEEERRAAHGAE